MKKSFISILFFCLAVSTICSANSKDIPVLIGLDYSELLRNKDDLAGGKTQTVASYNRVISIANGILTKTALKVTDGATPVSGNVHDFYTISSYAWPNPNTEDGMPWIYKDGYINEEAEGDDYDLKRYNTTIYYIKTLSLAWFYSGDEKYASKAAELLRVWFINEETRMTPAFEYTSAIPGVTNGRYSGIIYGVAMIDIIDFVYLLSMSESWTQTDDTNLKQWFADYLNWLVTSDFGIKESNTTNNHSAWYCAQVATFSIYSGNISLANTMVEKGKFHLDQQMVADGSLPRELARTRSFHYSYYGLDAFAALANCGSRIGNDLWNYELSDGRSFKKAFDFFLPYITKEKAWTWADIDSNEDKDADRINCIFLVRSARRVFNTGELKSAEDYIASIAPADNEKVWLMGRNVSFGTGFKSIYNDVDIQINKRMITLFTSDTKKYRLYSIQGFLIAEGYVAGQKSISVKQSGVYIIQAGNSSAKMLIY